MDECKPLPLRRALLVLKDVLASDADAGVTIAEERRHDNAAVARVAGAVQQGLTLVPHTGSATDTTGHYRNRTPG